MRLEVDWFGKFPQFLLSLKSSTMERGKSHWRQMNWSWIGYLVMQSNFDSGRAFVYALLNQLCICEVFVFPEQRSGFIYYVLFFFNGIFHLP